MAGRGRGSYVSFERKRLGANEHTIRFDNGQLHYIEWYQDIFPLAPPRRR